MACARLATCGSPWRMRARVAVAGWFKVVGTGFLVRKETVITNRHVLDALDSEMKSEGIPALGSMTPALSACGGLIPFLTLSCYRESLHGRVLDTKAGRLSLHAAT